MTDLIGRARERLQAIRDAGLYRQRRTFELLPGAIIRVDGRECIDFASNNYLGLAAQQPLAGTAGSGASALVSGRSVQQAELERRLAAFEQTGDALVFPTGYAANLGTVAALAASGDTIFVDKLDHSCLVEGARLSGGRLRVYRSDRLDRLARELGRATGRRFVVTDGVFSMEGTLAPLPELLALCEDADATLIVDEAHATGVFGANGRGSCEHFGLRSDRILRTGTLSKAFGGLGGFVTGHTDVIDWLRHEARTQMFSTALPPACCDHAIASLDIIEQQPDRRSRLHQSADRVREELRTAGANVPPSIGPIVPVIIGDPEETVRLATRLEASGLLVGCIRPPTVPRGTSRLRISVSAIHTDEQIDKLVAAIAQG